MQSVQGLTPVHNDQIVMPNGSSYRIAEVQAARVVEEYDASLILGQLDGQWTVFLRNGPIEGQPFPVLGLGPELPSPDLIQRRLHQADTRRHGGKIAERADRVNQQKIREARRKGDEGAGETAEAFDWAMHAKKQHPTPRIFVPGGKD